MINQTLFTIAFIVGFLSLIYFCEFIFKKFSLKAEITRKFAHIFSSLISLLFLFTFQSFWYVIILGVAFFFILRIGKHFNTFKSIDSVKRKTAGSYLLPISICLLFIWSRLNHNDLFFILPILILGISDPLASIFGTLYKNRTKKIVLFKYEFDKTYMGSAIFSISTFIISIIVLQSYQFIGSQLILLSLFIAFVSTFVEILSSNGFDNITVPHAVLLILYSISNL